MSAPINTSPEELFMLIGEERFLRYKTEQENKKLYAQIDEMLATIEKLRSENYGRLDEPDDNQSIRRVRERGEGEGRRFGDDVPDSTDEPAHRLGSNGEDSSFVLSDAGMVREHMDS